MNPNLMGGAGNSSGATGSAANGADGNEASGGAANGSAANGGAAAGGAANGGTSNAGANGSNGVMPDMAKCGNGTVDMGETCDPATTCPSEATCTSTNVCLKPVLSGMPSTCSAKCEFEPIEECVPDDGCCPKGCNVGTDNDCSDSCGDGVIGKGETCEPTSPTMPCPTSCDDMDPCTKDTQTGTAAQCNVECTHTPITVPASGDQCCPPGANANNDSDCKAMCGNGVKEGSELCDGVDCPSSCDDRDPCTADKLMGSAAACTAMCSNTPITRPAGGDGCCPDGANANNDSDCSAMCGNGVREGNEKCDGDCPTSCDDRNPCTMDIPIGSASQCNADCNHRPITQPAHNDGCCPDRANANNDNDCRPRCGNGVPEGSETCDGDCSRVKATCTSGPCTMANYIGTEAGCNLECARPTPIGNNGGVMNACGGCNKLPNVGLSGGEPKEGDICQPGASSHSECMYAGITACSGKDFLVCKVRSDVQANPDNGCGVPNFDDDCDGRLDEGGSAPCQ